MRKGSIVAERIISVSGLRGIVGISLTPEVAVQYVSALAAELPPGPILISRDGRASGPLLAIAISDALARLGRRVLNAGVAATPTTGVLIRHHRAAGGVQISASHNPAEYNGLKLFSAEGRVSPAAAGLRVLDRFRTATTFPAADTEGTCEILSDTVSHHLSLILPIVDADRIRKRRFRVLLDSNHGAGSLVGRRLLEELGCEVLMLGGNPDGQFAHTPEPTAENLASVLKHVIKAGADIGFCQDPDADRLAIIDERGRYIGEEYTLALCVDHELRRRPGPIVTNCSTSRISEDLAAKYDVPFFRSAVGEANVVDEMIARDAILGGEGNGGVIDPRVGWVRDSFVGMALVLDAMASRQQSMSRLVADLPKYEIVKTKITIEPARIPAALAALQKHFSNAHADTLDGLRLDWPDKWLLVRASNTEPIVRAIAEAPTAADASRLCDEAANVLAAV
jgi:phosphomannomutase